MTREEREQLLVKLGKRIGKIRLQQDKTRKEVAAYLKITTQSYGCVERGTREIGVTRLIDLAEYFHVTVRKLLDVK